MSNPLFLIAVGAFLLIAMVSDLRTRRIPNWLTVSAWALGVTVHTAVAGLAGLKFSLVGFGAGFGVLLVLWLIGGGGGGDVKMMGALGAWLGAWLTIQVFIVSAVVTVALLCGRMLVALAADGLASIRRRRLAAAGERPKYRREAAKEEKGARRPLVPYAVPLAVSTWIVLAFAWKTGVLP